MADSVDVYLRQIERLKNARSQAEQLLEEKSRELFIASEQLKEANKDLESRVADRTADLRIANKALVDAAKRDAATGLYNSSYFTTVLDRHCRHLKADDPDTHFSLVYFDLDGFKAIKDSYGHHVGDSAILELADLVKDFVPRKAYPSRHGGDEFIVLLPHSDLDEAVELAAGALDKMRSSPLTFGSLIVTASIGIASAPFAGTSSRELYIAADAAMYEAKKNGRNQYQCFSEELRSEIANRGHIANALKKAIADRAIDLAFQPQYSVNGQLKGAEVLARWDDPELGQVSPTVFVQVAEETGQIVMLGDVVLEKAIDQITVWTSGGLLPEGMKVAVNVSVLQLITEDFLHKVESNLQRSPELSNYLELEITESIMVRDFQLATNTIEKLRGFGISVALDDFGTVHSGLSYLCQLPVDKIKVDRLFTVDVPKSTKTRAVVSSMLTLASELDMKAVVEGVETQEELDAISSLGDCLYQGYFFSKPVDTEAFQKLLAKAR